MIRLINFFNKLSNNNKVLITGAGSGLGQGLSIRFARLGNLIDYITEQYLVINKF